MSTSISALSTSRKAEQLALFEEATAISTSAVVGLRVILPGRFCICGHNIAAIGSSRGPHHASLICSRCGVHRGWVSGETYRFISTIIDTIGRPVEPINVTTNSRACVDDQQ